MSRKGSGFFFFQSLPISLSTFLYPSFFFYTPLLLWLSGPSCLVLRNKVRKIPKLKESPEKGENQVVISIFRLVNTELVRKR